MRRRTAGFTLLELMISLAIVGFVSLIVMVGLQVASRAWQAGDREVETQQRLRILIDHLFDEVKSSYNLIFRQEDSTFLLFKGASHRMDFVSTADSIGATYFSTGLKLVSLYVANGGRGPQGLIIQESDIDYSAEDPFSIETDGLSYSLAPDVTSISIRYYSYPPATVLGEEETRGEWFNEWGGDTEVVQTSGDSAETDLDSYIQRFSNLHLPSGVEISLHMVIPDRDNQEVELPPIYISLQDCTVHSLIQENAPGGASSSSSGLAGGGSTGGGTSGGGGGS